MSLQTEQNKSSFRKPFSNLFGKKEKQAKWKVKQQEKEDQERQRLEEEHKRKLFEETKVLLSDLDKIFNHAEEKPADKTVDEIISEQKQTPVRKEDTEKLGEQLMDLDILIQQANSLISHDKINTLRKTKGITDSWETLPVKLEEINDLLSSANLVYFGTSIGPERMQQIEKECKETLNIIENVMNEKKIKIQFTSASSFGKYIVQISKDLLNSAQDFQSVSVFTTLVNFVQGIMDGLIFLKSENFKAELLLKTKDVVENFLKMKRKPFDSNLFLNFRNSLKSHLQLLRTILVEKTQMERTMNKKDFNQLNLNRINSKQSNIRQNSDQSEVASTQTETKVVENYKSSLENLTETVPSAHQNNSITQVFTIRSENGITDAVKSLKQLASLLEVSEMKSGSGSGVDVVKLSQITASTARELVTILNSNDIRCHRLVYLLQLLGGASKTAACISELINEELLKVSQRFIQSISAFLEALNESGNNTYASIVTEEKQLVMKDFANFLSTLASTLKAERVKCSICHTIIPGAYVKIQDNPICTKCYVCYECCQPLEDCYPVEDKLYCLEHYKKYLVITGLAMSCFACGQAITDKYMKDNNRVWHIHCFNCIICKRSINETYYDVSNKLVCANCLEEYKEKRKKQEE